MQSFLSEIAIDRLKGIHGLSAQLNQQAGKDHQDKLLQLVRSHVDEIETLYAKKDAHAFIETGDLLVLCLELLVENQVDSNEIIAKCFDRYEKKLTSLLKK